MSAALADLSWSAWRKVRWEVLWGACLALISVPWAALGAELVLPQWDLEIGDGEQSMPIAINGASDVQGVELAIAYDPSVVRLSADPERTAMSANCMVVVNATVPGQMRVALACPNSLHGSGPLLTLSLLATGAGTTEISLERCDLNEGAVACTTHDGSITVTGVAPQPGLARFIRVESAVSTSVDRLTIRGGFQLPTGSSFAEIDPQANGAQILVAGPTGSAKVAVQLPAGAYDGPGTRGWSRRSGGWLYLDRTEDPIDGITRMAIWDGERRMSGLVLLRVKGKAGGYPVAATDLPLSFAANLGGRTSISAGHVESAFTASSCTTTGGGATRQCRQ